MTATTPGPAPILSQAPPAAFMIPGPTYLEVIGALTGVALPDPEQPFTQVQIGCGDAQALIALAASYPHGRFFGIDPRANMVASGRRLVRKAALENVVLLDCELRDIASLSLPLFDYVVLDSVFPYTDAVEQAALLGFLNSHVAVGGVVSVGYHALPGQATTEAVRRLIGNLTPAGSSAIQRSELARTVAKMLSHTPMGPASASPKIAEELQRIASSPDSFAAPEYLAETWRPFSCVEMFRMLGSVRLSFVNSIGLPLMFDDAVVPPEHREFYQSLASTESRQALRDMLLDSSYRRDLFVRGAVAIGPLDLDELRQRIHVISAPFGDGYRHEAILPSGAVELPPGASLLYASLRDHARPLAEIIDRAAPDGYDVFDALRWLFMTDQALPARAPEVVNSAVAYRFNRAAIRIAGSTGHAALLTAPMLGGAVELNPIDTLLALGVVEAGIEHAGDYLAGRHRVWGRVITLQSGEVVTPDTLPGFVGSQMPSFTMMRLPQLRALGITLTDRRPD